MTKRIARELALPLTLHAVLAPQLERTRALDPKAFALDGIPPELALVGAAIVALKLVYGLSGINM
jgi:RNA polymerase I-specific transcription initiation factor RRN7